jgi:hypothetical protein
MTDKTWVVYDGPNSGMDWFETKEEAEDYIHELISDECEGGFSLESEDLYVLRVVGRAKLSLWKKKVDQIIDDDGYDEDGDYWDSDVDKYCHLKYVMIQEDIE